MSDIPINRTAAWSWLVPILFTVTIFLSASLLFFVQPLFTKITLRYIGGAPAVWTTAMLFFQTVLIAGYFYAHLSTRYLPVLAQVALHVLLWAVALFFIPLSVPTDWQFDPNQQIAFQTLVLFAVGVGIPFAVLSANAPLIQSWYAKTGGPSADDPYFLYGASNFGSLIALLAFPLLAEPFFGASQIGWGWAAGFAGLGVFLGVCGLMARKGVVQHKTVTDHVQPSMRQLGWWLFLAFVPSSLMLGVTTTISTDLGSFPLIWVLPLSLYLLTFVLTFTNRPRIWGRPLHWMFIASMAVFAIGLTNVKIGLNTISLTAVFLVAFFAVALKFHRMLYEARPGYSDLTLFYVVMSVGGALGGLFNSIVAPAAFSGLYELPLTILLAALILLKELSKPNTRSFTKIILSVAIAMIPLAVLRDVELGNLTTVVFVLLPVAVLLWNRDNGLASFCVIATLLAVGFVISTPQAIFRDRSFFGTHLVRETDTLRLYANGTTVHGAQLISETESVMRPTPLFYYHREGPLGQIVTSDIASEATDIGVVGLGIGAMACFAQPGQRWQYYEIDALVDRVARDPSLFSFMSNCAGDAPTHLGDARVVLEQQEDTRYDILVIDAYSSDAVPLHLTTNEAIDLYFDRLKDNGILVLHISNRYYDLSLPLGRSASALGVEARIQDYPGDSTEPGNVRSVAVVMARDAAALATLDETGQWDPLTTDGGDLWTDDYTDLLSVLNWKIGG